LIWASWRFRGMTSKQKLVVIGNGMAGARVVEEILARGGREQFEISMFGEEPYGNYNRILLSDVLNGSHEAEDIFLNPLAWYADNGVKLHAGVKVSKILRHAQQVEAEGGIVENYDRLIIATGSLPFLPPMDGLTLPDGSDKPGVFVFRNLEDCRKITAYALGKKRGVVIGGGLLGLEAARGLQNFSLDVHVIQRGNSIMGQQLDDPAAAILKKTLEGLGIVVHTNRDTRAIRGHDQVTGLEFKDGTRLSCDLVVIAAGIKANSGLALRAGLAVERGIVVDNRLCTDDPRIFAVGECVQHRGQSARRPSHRRRRRRRVPRLEGRHQAEGDGGRGRLHGHHRAHGRGRRSRSIHRSQERHVQEADHPQRALGRRHPAR